ncbi:LANO_0H20032g1_1 [Lachancea nothofagi CBS 11611]|uniref:LANO_0H20032g1_1 n=1 Tax=Lachancea nothofagi CBS 11611 TaxID=1266666 RepID=A0A1G4KNB3_9SACH|nr:LANO_0H20032g1_1 [Lachancea nothofagi CBS 11611]
MSEQLAEKIPDEITAALYPGPVAATGVEEGDEHDEPLEKTEEKAGAKNVSSLLQSQDNAWMKILYFAGSCSVNLVLPFFNGLMLGFGELIAHEVSWKLNWFKKSNQGYKIYPETRKIAAQKQMELEQQKLDKRAEQFL